MHQDDGEIGHRRGGQRGDVRMELSRQRGQVGDHDGPPVGEQRWAGDLGQFGRVQSRRLDLAQLGLGRRRPDLPAQPLDGPVGQQRLRSADQDRLARTVIPAPHPPACQRPPTVTPGQDRTNTGRVENWGRERSELRPLRRAGSKLGGASAASSSPCGEQVGIHDQELRTAWKGQRVAGTLWALTLRYLRTRGRRSAPPTRAKPAKPARQAQPGRSPDQRTGPPAGQRTPAAGADASPSGRKRLPWC